MALRVLWNACANTHDLRDVRIVQKPGLRVRTSWPEQTCHAARIETTLLSLLQCILYLVSIGNQETKPRTRLRLRQKLACLKSICQTFAA